MIIVCLHSNVTNGDIASFFAVNPPYSALYKIRIEADSPFVIGEPSPFDIAITDNCNQQRNPTITDLQVNLFPNPAFGNVTIEFKSRESFEKEIQIIDLQGRVFVNRRLSPKEYSVMIDIAALVEGMYIVTVKTASGFVQKKLMVTGY